jgi:hypothetical protein
MLLIAHRGLMEGPNPDLENCPEQIEKALKEGFNVEIDLWCLNNQFFLGHDEPQYEVPWNYIDKTRMWVHCKNLGALFLIRKQYPRCQYFWHQNDDFTLTSGGFIWTYPGKPLTENSICVLPETKLDLTTYDPIKCYGICSDYVNLLRNRNDIKSI